MCHGNFITKKAVRLPFIYYVRHHTSLAIYPPTRTSSPQASVYMILQPMTDSDVACHHTTGGLLPRHFTLTARRQRYISVTVHSLSRKTSR